MLLVKIKPWYFKLWPILIILFLAIAFHIKLFYPQPSLYVTPDYGESDLIDSKIPTQYVMWKNLQENKIPLWESNISQGYPELDGLEMGFFYIPNLILFKFLPFWLAFNLGYVLNVVLTATGTYIFSRSFRLSKTASLLAAIIFSFSPIFALHAHHYNLILALSTIPWLYWLVNSFFNTQQILYLLLIPLVISQQFFAGSPQIPTYNLFFLTAFFLFKLRNLKIQNKLKTIIIGCFLATLVLGLAIASVQLLPTYKLSQNSSWFEQANPKAILTDFPYKPKNLLTILNPYILGNPKEGTYPHWRPSIWGIFWEDNTYFGIIPLVLIVLSFLLIKKTAFQEHKRVYFFWLSSFFLGIILSLGTEAPLHPIFSIPPFSFFRVPSRFLFISFFSAAQLSAITIDTVGKIKKKNKYLPLINFLILTIAATDVFIAWFNYNLVGNAKDWLQKPKLTEKITQGRHIAYGDAEMWNGTFLKSGWLNQEEYYLFYVNFLKENSNLLFGVSNLFGYESINPERISFSSQLAQTEVKTQQGKLIIGKNSQKVLDFSNVNYLTTQYELKSEDWKLLETVQKDEKKINLYKNEGALPHAFVVNDYKIAKTKSEVVNAIQSKDFDPKRIVILEEEAPIEKENGSTENQATIKTYENQKVEIETKVKKTSLLVLSDTFYPGWKALVDGEQTKIYPANVNSRAIVVPAGFHHVKFIYEPEIIKRSALTSFVSLLLLILLTVKFKNTRVKVLK